MTKNARGKKRPFGTKCLFSKMEDKKVRQVLSGGWYQ
jgi:hypothetical protein